MIRVENLTKTFRTRQDEVTAVDAIDFEVAAGEMVTLLGPSGCGKTTSLRCVAGLDRPGGGSITVGDQRVVDCDRNIFVPPNRRRVGMVFQSYAIWPHMTVYENVAYALEGERFPRAEIRKRTLEALELVKLETFADRPAPRLSGGQQQRVAIARAIVGHPQALLFDEPLSNLDAKLRTQMRIELRRLQQQVGITSIYVTHDQSEALAISDWIIVMRKGKIVERGRPLDIYARPRSLFTAHFIGHTNLIAGQVTSRYAAESVVRLKTSLGFLSGIDPNGDLREGDAARISIRPEDMQVLKGGALAENSLTGRVALMTFQGTGFEGELETKGELVQCYFGREMGIGRGDEVTMGFDTSRAIALRDEPIEE